MVSGLVLGDALVSLHICHKVLNVLFRDKQQGMEEGVHLKKILIQYLGQRSIRYRGTGDHPMMALMEIALGVPRRRGNHQIGAFGVENIQGIFECEIFRASITFQR